MQRSTVSKKLAVMLPSNTITSRDNPSFKRIRLAIEEHEEEIAIEGPKHVRDAIAAGWRPLLVAHEAGVEPPAIPRRTPTLEFTTALFRPLADTLHSQGVIALFERPVVELESLFAETSKPLVVLDGVQDPGNVGTIIRLAAAFDAAGVIATEGTADPYSPKAIRSSASAILQTRVTRCSARQLILIASKHEFSFFAATGKSGGVAEFSDARSILVFGSEGRGVSPELRSISRELRIEIAPAVESLNVAAAAAILLHQSFERRR